MKTITRNLSISLALIGGAALATPALADGEYTLAFEPALLSSAEGMQQLHSEIRTVAEDYCPTYQDVRSFQEVSRCRADVVADLVVKIDRPAFSEFVASKSRRSTPELLAAVD